MSRFFPRSYLHSSCTYHSYKYTILVYISSTESGTLCILVYDVQDHDAAFPPCNITQHRATFICSCKHPKYIIHRNTLPNRSRNNSRGTNHQQKRLSTHTTSNPLRIEGVASPNPLDQWFQLNRMHVVHKRTEGNLRCLPARALHTPRATRPQPDNVRRQTKMRQCHALPCPVWSVRDGGSSSALSSSKDDLELVWWIKTPPAVSQSLFNDSL